MPNPNSENTSENKNVEQVVNADTLTKTIQQQGEAVTNSAKEEVTKMGAAVQGQVQDLGKAGMAGVTGIVAQFSQPLSSTAPVQPPVSKDEKVYGALAYIPFISLACIVLKPDSAFVRLHSKQGLLLTVLFLFTGILAAIVSIFGILGQLLSLLLSFIPLACMIIGIYSMYLAMTGYWWKIPVLSVVADLIPVEMMAKISKENITGQVGIAKNDYDNRQDTLQKETSENKADESSQPQDVKK